MWEIACVQSCLNAGHLRPPDPEEESAIIRLFQAILKEIMGARRRPQRAISRAAVYYGAGAGH
jgi:hypothetical protein